MAYLFKQKFFSNGQTDKRTHGQTDGRSDYIMPQILFGSIKKKFIPFLGSTLYNEFSYGGLFLRYEDLFKCPYRYLSNGFWHFRWLQILHLFCSVSRLHLNYVLMRVLYTNTIVKSMILTWFFLYVMYFIKQYFQCYHFSKKTHIFWFLSYMPSFNMSTKP